MLEPCPPPPLAHLEKAQWQPLSSKWQGVNRETPQYCLLPRERLLPCFTAASQWQKAAGELETPASCYHHQERGRHQRKHYGNGLALISNGKQWARQTDSQQASVQRSWQKVSSTHRLPPLKVMLPLYITGRGSAALVASQQRQTVGGADLPLVPPACRSHPGVGPTCH